MLYSKTMRRGAGDQVSYGHSADERQHKHTHHSAPHFVGNQLLQQCIADCHGTYDPKAEGEKKPQRYCEVCRKRKANQTDREGKTAAQPEPSLMTKIA